MDIKDLIYIIIARNLAEGYDQLWRICGGLAGGSGMGYNTRSAGKMSSMNNLPTEFEKLDDIRIAFCQYGSGPNLLLLHGNSLNNRIFRQYQLNYFSMFHTYALDSRGHGQSLSDDDELSIDQISRDVILFCQARGIKQAYVIGYSDGGNIALHLAHKAPDLFPRIVAISPNTLVKGTQEETLNTLRGLHRFMGFLHRLGFNMKKHIMRFGLMLKDSGLSDDDLKTIRTRVKILYAEKDMVKEEHILHIAGLIPGAELEKIDGCTHISIIKDSRAIKCMREFLLT